MCGTLLMQASHEGVKGQGQSRPHEQDFDAEAEGELKTFIPDMYCQI